jgi:ATP-dependent protease ClpP protease subunit
MKKLFLLLVVAGLVFSCSSNPMMVKQTPSPQEVKVTVELVTKDGKPVSYQAQAKKGDRIMKSMEVRKEGYRLSQLSAKYGEKLFIKIFSGLSVADVTRAWTDMIIAVEEYKFTEGSEVHLFIDSPGGDAFSGLALADLIEFYQKYHGIKFIAWGTGIIASAAVPIFAVCDETHATDSTIFMVHEAALWKWPGRETASDIRSQGKLMDLLQEKYIGKLAENSAEFDNEGKKIDRDYWEFMEAKTSWFDVNRAKELGILDFIDN